MENLYIKNFLSIKELDVNLKRINVFIGPQAQGKSILTKLIYFFKNIPDVIVSSAMDGMTKREFDTACCSKFELIFPEYSWGNNFMIRYKCDSFFMSFELVSIKSGKFKLKISYSDEIKKALSQARNSIKKSTEFKDAESEFKDSLLHGNKEFIAKSEVSYWLYHSHDEPIQQCHYIPAGRSFFANLQKSIFSFIAVNAPVDFFLKEFGSMYERTKNLRAGLNSKRILDKFFKISKRSSNDIDSLVESLICGKYLSKDGQDWISGVSGEVKLENSSSGQQESLPMALVLSTWPYLNSSTSYHSFVIEEPEAHLFPNAQSKVISLIASAYNANQKSTYAITTHSPYILSALNNLIQAGNVISADSSLAKKVSSVVGSEAFIVKYEDVSVYYIDSGVAKNICNESEKIIDANSIDEVSNSLSKVFEDLLELEFETSQNQECGE